MAGCLSIATVGGGFWLWGYVRSQIVPLIQVELEQSLDRPVALGEIERVSLTGFRLGKSAIPATSTDSDQVNIGAIEIGFNPLDALTTRQVDLTVTLIQPQLFLEQTANGGWLATNIQFEQGSAIEVKEIRLRDGKVILAPSAAYARSLEKPDASNGKDSSLPPSRMLVERINGAVKLTNDAQHFQFDATAQADTGGTLRLQGEADSLTDKITANITSQELAIAPWVALLPIPVTVQSGTIESQLQVEIQPQQPLSLSGTIRIREGHARAVGEPNDFSRINGRLRLDGQTLRIEQGHLQFGKIPFDVVGTIDLQKGLTLDAKVASVSAADFMQTFNLKLPFPVAGALRSNEVRVRGSFDRVIFSGTAEVAAPLQFDRVPMANAKAAFVLDKSNDRLTLKDIEFEPTSGGKITTNAQLTLENDDAPLNVAVQAEAISVDAIAQLYGFSEQLADEQLKQLLNQLTERSSSEPIRLGRMNAQVKVAGTGNDPHITGQWQLAQGEIPASGKLSLANETLHIQETIAQFAQGTLAAAGKLQDGEWQGTLIGTDLNLAGGRVQVNSSLAANQWQVAVTGDRMQPGKLVSTLPDGLNRGKLSGRINLAGSLQNISPETIAATGQLQLTDTEWTHSSITADLKWQNHRLHVLTAEAAGIQFAGWLKPQFTEKPTIAAMDLAVRANSIDLGSSLNQLARQSSLTLPESVQLTGMASLEGRINGTAANPQFAGQVQFDRLAINQFQFDPVLAGKLSWAASGLTVELAGQTEQFRGQFDRALKTGFVTLKLDQATAEAHYNEGHLLGKLDNLALQQIQPIAPFALPMDGQLSAHYNISLRQPNQPRAVATVALTRPSWGKTATDKFTGTLSYIDGTAAIRQGELHLGDSRYTLNGRFTPDRDGEFAAQLSVKQGQIGDLWTAIDAMQQAPWITDRSIFAPLQNLKALNPAALRGKFAAEVAVQGSRQSGIKSSFQVQGQDWGWNQYGIQKVTAAGQFDGSQLQLMPLQLAGLTYAAKPGSQQVFDTKLSITGSYSARSQQGQIALEKAPVSMIKNWLNTSAPVEGELNATANISGNGSSVRNLPQVDGELKLSQLRLSQRSLPETHLRFHYVDDRFRVGGTSSVLASPEPASSSASSQAIGVNTIYFNLGLIDFTLPVDVLDTFISAGTIQQPLGFYAQFLDPQALHMARSILSQPLDPQKIDLAAIATSSSGEAWLQWLGELVQTHGGDNGKTVMQGAILAAAAEKPTGFTLMDVLHHAPVRKLRINTRAVINLLESQSLNP